MRWRGRIRLMVWFREVRFGVGAEDVLTFFLTVIVVVSLYSPTLTTGAGNIAFRTGLSGDAVSMDARSRMIAIAMGTDGRVA